MPPGNGSDLGSGPDPTGPSASRFQRSAHRGGLHVGTTVLGALFLLLAGWALLTERGLPAPVPITAPDSSFSSARAMEDLREIAQLPRPVGSPEHTRVRELLLARLAELGVDAEVQTSTLLRRAGEDQVVATTLRNVVVRVPGRASTGALLLTSHYDAVPLSPGAGDAGMAVAALLEVLRALQAGPELDNDLILLLTDGEEAGLLGARAFVREHPFSGDVSFVLALDMRGSGGASLMFETGPENGWAIQAMAAADPRPMAHPVSLEVYRRMPNDTDFTVFRQAGVQGLNFAGIGRHWVYHQATDRVEHVSEATLQHHGERILALSRELGGRDLTQVRGPDRLPLVLPGIGLLPLPENWVPALAVLLGLLWVAVLVWARRWSRWGASVGIGLGIGLLVPLLGAGAGWLLHRTLLPLHPEFGTLLPAVYGEGWYLLALALFLLTPALVVLALPLRGFHLQGVVAGALAWPIAGGVILAFEAPPVGLTLLPPLVAGALAACLVPDLSRPGAAQSGGPGPGGRGLRSAGVLLLSLPVLVFLVPLVELFGLAVTLRLAPVLGVLIALGWLCLLPALGVVAGRSWSWFATGSVVGALLLLAVGLFRGGASPERPLPSTALYAHDRGEQTAMWASRPDPGFEWVESQLGPLEGERDLGDFFVAPLYGTGLSIHAPYRVREISPETIPLPDVQVERIEGASQGGESASDRAGASGAERRSEAEDTSHGARDRYRVHLRSRVEAEVVGLQLSPGSGKRIVEVVGRPVPDAGEGGARTVLHHGVPPAPAGESNRPPGTVTFVVDLAPGAQELEATVTEQHLRPGDLLDSEVFQRPPELMPSTRTRSDRILLRTPVRLPLP